jgi:hypothetical protein
MGGSAILNAADNLKQTISQAAGRFLNCAPAEVEIVGDLAKRPQRTHHRVVRAGADFRRWAVFE